ncbi:MAG TPA: preprotein translocase subunit YajC [Cellulomonas sp.]|uniref:preprotein translocase subunit YajC n=1 Tax=Cellulomonas sp. TaxID=40001 RepID=UPI002E312809|nr:preprotein translocase subunit YajC [Cellulomonas sp.]HEX5334012.1 preprotein translocase subunit YajC [Cellulomonas sp.]
MDNAPFLVIILIAFGAMWLMSSRTRKQQRAAADFRSHLAPGQEVMTGSGMFGTVVAVDDDIITIESTPGNQTRWLRAAIAKVIEPAVDADQDDAAQDDAAGDDDIDGLNDAAVDVPDDLSSLPPARGDEDPEKK